MIEFDWPWAFFLLPLPWFMRYVLPRAQPACGAAIRVPFFAAFMALQPERSGHWVRAIRWPVLLAYLIWALLIAAMSHPQWVDTPHVFPISGRDLMLAVDISGSMATTDFTLDGVAVTRLDAVKAVAGAFIEARQGDRLGLVLFGSKAYLQAPLTFDGDTVKRLLLEAEIGWAGKETAIGDAIGLALKRLRHKPKTAKVLVLLTDGTNTAGIADPFQAAQHAAKAGLTIYTIGVGTKHVKLGGGFNANQQTAYLDEHSLEVIAKVTGGRYLKADNTSELRHIYTLLQAIEPTVDGGQYRQVLASLLVWPLSLAFFLSLVLTRWLMQSFVVKPV